MVTSVLQQLLTRTGDALVFPTGHASSGDPHPLHDEHPSAHRTETCLRFLSSAQTTASQTLQECWTAIVRFSRLLMRILFCLIAGIGTGLVVAGSFALKSPEVWDLEKIQRTGPPLGPVLLSIGIALLTAEVFLLSFLIRPARRRHHHSHDSSQER